jgi:hypothetical protein
MAPHAEETVASRELATAVHEPGLSKEKAHKARANMIIPGPPQFEDKVREREHLKGRLAAAFRIFGKYGFDESVYRLRYRCATIAEFL